MPRTELVLLACLEESKPQPQDSSEMIAKIARAIPTLSCPYLTTGWDNAGQFVEKFRLHSRGLAHSFLSKLELGETDGPYGIHPAGNWHINSGL